MKGHLIIKKVGLRPRAYKFEGNLKDLILTACKFADRYSKDLMYVLFVLKTEFNALLKYLKSKNILQTWRELDVGILFVYLEHHGICSFIIYVSNKICPGNDTRKVSYVIYRHPDFVRLAKTYSIIDINRVEFSLDELEKLNICEFLNKV